MHPMLNIAVKAATKAGNHIARSFDRVDMFDVTTKSPNDYVTEVDKTAEAMIIDTIHQAYPHHGIFAEESGKQFADSEFQWIIDPLDGTTNFIHGFPQFAVSIALAVNGELSHAVVLNPISQELYTASKGSGAQLNNHKIRVSNRRSLDGALLGTGFPYRKDQQGYMDVYMRTLAAMMRETAGVRRPGSAALDLAYLAAGRIDGFWELRLNPWDIAAGVLLIKEAGGIVGDMHGGSDYMQSGNIVAANQRVFAQMLQRFDGMIPDDLR